ncbi:hypothetical protein EHQ61_00700 [Leptospira wolffii]|uniref:hypothetical protein n=1 Tax=Leptospira wolffii TaxID=409998 RepID=UPI001084080E|nr:hypothetical protein [Leptospira wolffii]TGL55264.1 hypothetical protein EHQ61_00700 [Leptospira wolffii]
MSQLSIEERYINKLTEIRKNPKLLDNFRFNGNENDFDINHIERLRLNIAIYNDRKQSDYSIAKFLFEEEIIWRKSLCKGDADDLYFSAFIISLFGNPEVIWHFLDIKNIDMDSGIGFDVQYFLFFGVHEVYKYLSGVNNKKEKKQLLKYIGKTKENCKFSQKEIDNWIVSSATYFDHFKFPVKDEMQFYYFTDERDLFISKFQDWVTNKETWTSREEISDFAIYSEYIGDKSLQIEACKLEITHNEFDFLSDILDEKLARLYLDNNEFKKAFELLTLLISKTENRNIVRNCIEIYCEIILRNDNPKDVISKSAFDMIMRYQKIYRRFSPFVDELIDNTISIMNGA